MLDIATSPLLRGAKHAFLGRAGGVSEGIYRGLNIGLGSDDDRDVIMENRRRATEGVLPGSELVTVHQIHSAEVVTVTAPLSLDQRPLADAMVTDRPNLLLGILTADCVPVLFLDSSARVIGAAHAGWKGALAGVTNNVIGAMEKLGADRDNIACAIGPCIAQASYEVDAAFRDRFLEADAANDRFFAAGRPGHFQFDIEDYVAALLQGAGISRVDKLGLDTYADEDRYYSYRRSCHCGEAGYGRQISLIGLAV
ncbi:peptidoglycan editing factor PgeF [Sphingorhabdus sp. SMR4y]|uniref:peptidoglycan editing factor PgeF n=1 Tax=Sphingorhabdus sp. SMR4y TaxID=2584094 RepID=UPI000B60C0DB|nr:peptidoglycan editing factor PgeF [Sphingorhabdus sp. SMR4y]ASK88348.1 laccase domain protein YfiH [Sphingorhabdus sp. SMR4y]